MKTIPRHLTAISCITLSVFIAPFVLAQTTPSENSSGAISVDRAAHYSQTGYGQVALQQSPYVFTFHVRGGAVDLKTNWGPKFYKAGSGGTIQAGASSATNTGTLNFSDAPNSGSDFMFVHEFDNDAAMQSSYPIAPTGGGQYGVKFLGSSAPAPEFTDGLVYAAGITYPVATPQILEPDPEDANGAFWGTDGKLHLSPSGLTTLPLNTFTEYSSSTYGSLIAVGIYDSSGNVIAAPSKTSYYLPVGDSTEDDDPIIQDAITEISLDGSWLTPGVTYTLELQYAIIAGRPEEALLSGVEFQGVTSYRRVTTISLVAGSASGTDFNADGNADILLQNSSTGERAIWFMNGSTYVSAVSLGVVNTAWSIAATADFNGDGDADILFQHTATGECAIWFMNGSTYVSAVSLGVVNTAWSIAATADFNGDGDADILFQNTATGERYIWFMNGSAYASGASLGFVDTSWSIAK